MTRIGKKKKTKKVKMIWKQARDKREKNNYKIIKRMKEKIEKK